MKTDLIISLPTGVLSADEMSKSSDFGRKMTDQCFGLLYIYRNVYNENGMPPNLLF